MDSVIHMIDQSSINLFTENDATNILVDTLESLYTESKLSLYTESKLPPWNGQNMTCMNGITVKKFTLPPTYPNSAGTHCSRYKWMPDVILGSQEYTCI